MLQRQASNIKLHLAPMEGVVDWVLRDTLTAIGGIDHCVTEFLRVSNSLYPDHVFYENCPELKNQSRTLAGTPVYLQILGSDLHFLTLNALKAVELGAMGIDLNFGCPAKTVNRHDGGASLLKSPQRIYQIIHTLRRELPAEIPLTAKIRLGYDDPHQCLENAIAIENAGAAHLTVHCRTKTDGYKPPAYWEWIPRIREVVKLPLIVNGEIWTVEDFQLSLSQTQESQFMIGRGSLKDPFIFQKIKKSIQQTQDSFDPISSEPHWEKIKVLLPGFYEKCIHFASERFAIARTKQWLKFVAQNNEYAKEFFDQIKIIENEADFRKFIFNQ